jgi:cbb3-type cytochrome oxidase subunit 3
MARGWNVTATELRSIGMLALVWVFLASVVRAYRASGAEWRDSDRLLLGWGVLLLLVTWGRG